MSLQQNHEGHHLYQHILDIEDETAQHHIVDHTVNH